MAFLQKNHRKNGRRGHTLTKRKVTWWKLTSQTMRNKLNWAFIYCFYFPLFSFHHTSLWAWKSVLKAINKKMSWTFFFCDRVNLKPKLFFLYNKQRIKKNLSIRFTFGIGTFALHILSFFNKVSACLEVLTLGRWHLSVLSREVPKFHSYRSTLLRGKLTNLEVQTTDLHKRTAR